MTPGGEEDKALDDALRRADVRRLSGLLDPSAPEPLVPRLLEWWQQIPQAVRPVLNAVPADTLAVILGERIDAGAWGFLDLLAGRTLLRTPALTEIGRRLRAEGRDRAADSLVLVDGPLRDPAAERQDGHETARPTGPTGVFEEPSRRELLRLARTGGPDQIRRALTRLAENHPRRGAPAERASTTTSAPPDPELHALIGELLHHPRPRVRLHAHRTSRALYDRATYPHHTAALLGDAQPGVVRSAVRTLTHAGWEPAVPAIVGLLDRITAAEESEKTGENHMIVWINGAFGAGKTTLVAELHSRWPDALVYDPEQVGGVGHRGRSDR